MREGALVGRCAALTRREGRLQAVIERSRALLAIRGDWKVGIVPGHDTGAIDEAMWSLLGSCPIHMLTWESFGQRWMPPSSFTSVPASSPYPYRWLPDLAVVGFTHDVVFPWNRTTSGIRVPDARGFPPIAPASCCATPGPRCSRLPWIWGSSTSSPGADRRCSAAKRRTA